MPKPFCLSHLTNVEGLKLNLKSHKTFKKSIKKLNLTKFFRAENLFTTSKNTSVTTHAKHGLIEYFRDHPCKTWLDVDIATNF